MRKLFLFLALLLGLSASAQQQKIRVTLSTGEVRDIPVDSIEEMSFKQANDFNIEGEWFWASKAEKSGIAVNFFDDGLMSQYQFYNSASIGPTPGSLVAAGQYVYNDGILKWIRNGDTSISKYTVSKTSDTEFTLGCMGLATENDIFYKVQSTLSLSTNSDAISVGNAGDEILYVDDYYVKQNGNKIYGRNVGTGYIIVADKQLNTTVAYKVNVTRGPITPIHFENYLNKSYESIVSEYGEGTKKEEDTYFSLRYYDVNAEVYSLWFTIYNSDNAVNSLLVTLYDNDCIDAYHNDIKSRYILDSSKSDDVDYYYYDNENEEARTLLIHIDTKNANISYISKIKI